MAKKFVIPPPNTTLEKFFVSDTTNHPEMPAKTMILKQDAVALSDRCCCNPGRCVCLNELEDLGFPDLTICFTGVDDCTDCFVSEVCVTLEWNGDNYTGSAVVDPGDCGGETGIEAHLSCEGSGDDGQCRDPTDDAPAQDVDGKWWVTLFCDGCFWGVVTATACDPLSLEGTICLDGPDTIISKCCDTVMGSGIYGCVDFTVTLAP